MEMLLALLLASIVATNLMIWDTMKNHSIGSKVKEFKDFQEEKSNYIKELNSIMSYSVDKAYKKEG
jgi:hypothetical protein